MRRYPAALEIFAVFGNLLVEGGQVGLRLAVAAVLAFVEDLATLAACLYQQPLGGLVHAGAPVGELGEKSLGDFAGHRNAPVFLGITD